MRRQAGAPARLLPREITLSVDPRQCMVVLLTMVGALIALHLVSLLVGERSYQLSRLFNLDLESNVPTWFSSGLWGLGSIAAFQCVRWSSPLADRMLWLAMAFGLLFFSCDEVATIHENLGMSLAARVFHTKSWTLLDLPWPIGGPLAIVASLWVTGTLRHALRGFPNPAIAPRPSAVGDTVAQQPMGGQHATAFGGVPPPAAIAPIGAGLPVPPRLGGVGLHARNALVLGAMFCIASVLIDAVSDHWGTRSPRLIHEVMLILEESFEMIAAIVVFLGLLTHQCALRRDASKGRSPVKAHGDAD